MKIKILKRNGNKWIGEYKGKKVTFRTTLEADTRILLTSVSRKGLFVKLKDKDFIEKPVSGR